MGPIIQTWLKGGERAKGNEGTVISSQEVGNSCYALLKHLTKLFPAISQDTGHVTTKKAKRVKF